MTTTTTTTTTTKTATFTMGLPAAGKSTWIAQNITGQTVVDPDAIKETHPEYDPKNPAALHVWSKQVAAIQFAECLAGDADFVVDGTGTNVENMVQKMWAAQAAGFSVRLVYITVPLAVSLERNAKRERNVPESIVREKFETVATAFVLVSKEADQVLTIDNR